MPSRPRWENNREVAGLIKLWPSDLFVVLHKGETVSEQDGCPVHVPIWNLLSPAEKAQEEEQIHNFDCASVQICKSGILVAYMTCHINQLA